jgi:hypothetical protein
VDNRIFAALHRESHPSSDKSFATIEGERFARREREKQRDHEMLLRAFEYRAMQNEEDTLP